MKNMSRPFSEGIAEKTEEDILDQLSETFPGIPKDQIERAKQYKIARKEFVETLSPALSESDRRHQIAQFSQRWWKIDEE